MKNLNVERFILTILEFAIADEKASQEKYKWLALNAARKEIREMFLRLYQEEREHEKKMMSLFNSMKKNMKVKKASAERMRGRGKG